jgi:predicted RNA-binding Zn-ribbon protein involved in translation (DUF1610 family)
MANLICSCPKCGEKVIVREDMAQSGSLTQMSGEPPAANVTCEKCGITFPPKNISAERGA